jgi:hypothetical protein
MSKVILRKYGEAATFNFDLFEIDGIDFKVDAVHVVGDTKIMKDEGVEANTTNGFTDEGQGYSIVLTATEMQHARGKVYIVDQGTKAWLDTGITIETYGHASAQHPYMNEGVLDRVLSGATHNVVDSTARRLRNLQEFGDYEHDSVWIDTINGTAGTTDYESGTINNKVDNIADANTIGLSLNKSGRAVVAGSTITFAASQENQNFWGDNWTLALGGQSVSGSHIRGADITGICTGVNPPEFHECHIGAVTVPPITFVGCDLEGIITLPVGSVNIRHCAGDAGFAIDYGATVANTTVNLSDFSGVMTISNLGANGTDILNVRGHGKLIFDASCVGGTVNWDGHFTVINNGSGITITPDDITTNVTAISGAGFDTNTDSLEAIRDRGDAAWVTGAGSLASVILAEKVETLLDINKPLDLVVSTTTRLQYQWLDVDGDPVNITALNFKFKAVKNAGEASPAIPEVSGTIVDAPNGRFYFDVLPTTVFKGRYEIWATDGVITTLTMAGGARIETHPRL